MLIICIYLLRTKRKQLGLTTASQIIIHDLIFIDSIVDSQEVLQHALQALKEKFRIFHITIQVETYQPSIMSSCPDCLTLNVPINS